MITRVNYAAPNRRAAQPGFTLIEIMVALAILALTGIALLTNVSQASRDLSVLNDKLEALSIAEYELNRKLMLPEFPEPSAEEEIITVGDREWRIRITISNTLNEKMRRIDVSVQPKIENQPYRDQATILLSGFAADL